MKLCVVLSGAMLAAAFVPAGLAAQSSGLDLKAIDQSVSPCEDFYQYACGNWLKANPIPPEDSRRDRFEEVHDRNEATLRAILEDSAAHQKRSEIDQKIGGFYASCMNESTVDQRGTTPLQSELERIQHISNKAELLDEIVRLHERQVGVFFNLGALPDPKDSGMEIAGIDQGGIGLPERDYYFRQDQNSAEIRRKYLAHMSKILQLAGIAASEAPQKAGSIMTFETALAKASLDVTSQRDPQNVIHEMTLAELEKLSPNFEWRKYFEALHAPELAKLNVGEPEFFKTFSALLESTSMADLKDYLTWHFVHDSARLLTPAFVDENFEFYGKTLSGTKELKPRWKRCVAAADDELGDALGRKFVEKTFGEQGKERTLEMVREIESAMAKDIDSITWMSADTKQQALLKLRAVTNKIGYPDKWRDYSTVDILPEDYFGNWYRANEFESKRQRNKIGKAVDRMEWDFTTPTVNAGYDPLQNTINFPAGILQSPFFSNAATDAANYGAIGMVIGHELTHGFDDEGRQFDATGNLRDWWQKSDEQKFEQKADCLSKSAGEFEAVPGVKVNGKLTLGENTADNGGLRVAYTALLNELEKRDASLKAKSDGYTTEQQFFLGNAQVWCENIRPEQARMYAQTDPHPPAKFRVDGVVINMPEFQRAFGCKQGDKMYRANACRVW